MTSNEGPYFDWQQWIELESGRRITREEVREAARTRQLALQQLPAVERSLEQILESANLPDHAKETIHVRVALLRMAAEFPLAAVGYCEEDGTALLQRFENGRWRFCCAYGHCFG